MPRRGRLHLPGGYYHVMGRGLERRRIFSADEDKRDFLARLGVGLAQTGCQCLAFAIMSNHYHLLIRVSALPLCQLMGKLLSGYATQYNRRHNRSGYVFQNRFKSILCDADSYLLQLIRYIHLNPLKARIAAGLDDLDHYPWTGHAGLMGRRVQPWHSRNAVLDLFGHRTAAARKAYREFIQQGMLMRDTQDLSGGGLIRSYGGWDTVQLLRREHVVRIGDERILGDSDFVQSVLNNDVLSLSSASKWQAKSWGLDELVNAVCAYFHIEKSALRHRGRLNKLLMVKGLISFRGPA